MYCTKCGNEVSENNVFCSKCGVKLNKNEKVVKKKNRNLNTIIIAFVVFWGVVSIAFTLRNNNFKKSTSNFEIGDVVAFGRYIDDCDPDINSVGKTEWIVLQNNDGKLLLISKNVLLEKPYNTEYKDITWDSSYLRKWLNYEFIEETFNPEEQSIICDIHLDNSDEFHNGRDTVDKVFLLSTKEATQYFDSEQDRCAKIYVSDYNGSISRGSIAWWLRTRGNVDWPNETCIGIEGDIFYHGMNMDLESGVRPAMWVDISDVRSIDIISKVKQ